MQRNERNERSDRSDRSDRSGEQKSDAPPGSFRSQGEAVKSGLRGVRIKSEEGLARHLEGWQPALLCVLLAGSAALLAVPRPVAPREVPTPLIEPRALARAIANDEARADAAEREPLDVDVRALGSAMRAYGVADSAGEERALAASRSLVTTAAAHALDRGEEGVLRLRAYALRSFLREVRLWEATGEETDELRELGGGFLRMLRNHGWCEEGPTAARRVLMGEAAMRAAWKRRWNEIAGIRSSTFEPTLDEQRSFYRFLLEHPMRFDTLSAAASIEASRAYSDQYVLKKIEELSTIDPAYPKDFARGIVLYKLGRYLLSVEAFRRHLDASPDGPFTLRAQNYLRAALAQTSDP